MHDLLSMDLPAIEALLDSWGQPRFRAKQLHQWIAEHKVEDFEAMHNLPRALRERLATECSLGTLALDTEQNSQDGTIKRLYRLDDGQLIESVLMPCTYQHTKVPQWTNNVRRHAPRTHNPALSRIFSRTGAAPLR